MTKDWVVWLGCIFLFGAGAIWGAVPIDTKFFKVDSFHDLAEILGAVATAIAVCLGVAGINAWRAQAVATSDHELARRAAVILQKYKFASERGLELSRFLVTRITLELGKKGASQRTLDEVRGELKQLEDIKSEITSVALECRVVWGEDVWKNFEDFVWLGDRCRQSIELFLRWSREDLSDKTRAIYSTEAIENFEEVKFWVGEDKQRVDTYFEEKFSPLYLEIKSRLLR